MHLEMNENLEGGGGGGGGGALLNIIPIMFICILVRSVSLRGLPFLTGFCSKHLIVEIAYGS